MELNGKVPGRKWISQKELVASGKLVFTATDQPLENTNIWLTDMNKK
ncbi:hypothetical protein [Pedobacter ginsengisoli]|nr:hypothetical protein [Pedobacter ginsengisoli]